MISILLIQVVLKLVMHHSKHKLERRQKSPDEADVIIFMVNVREGLTQSDEMVASNFIQI